MINMKMPTIFKQYWLNQLWKKNIANLGHKYIPIENKKRPDKRDLLCAICGKEKDLLAPVSPFKVSPEGLKKLTPQPQMLIGGMYINKHGHVIDFKVPANKFSFNYVLPYITQEPETCMITKKPTHKYYIVYNAYVCRKCIWHVLGNKRGRLKVDGTVVEY